MGIDFEERSLQAAINESEEHKHIPRYVDGSTESPFQSAEGGPSGLDWGLAGRQLS